MRKIKKLFLSMLVTTVVSFNSIVLASDITVGGSSQSGYQSIGYCSYDDLNCSKLLVDNFMEEMEKYGDAEILFNYSDKSAWEQDVKPGNWKNDSVDDVNFMIYCGHGVKKGSKKFVRNSLHYFTENSFTLYHPSDDTSERVGASNLTTAEAKWGKTGTETKWVALFTCNFLNEDDAYCTGMMQGINICMGFSTTMFVYAAQGYTFGNHVSGGNNIIDSFFASCSYFQPGNGECDVVAKVIYAEGARYDTIYDYAYKNSKPSPIGGSTKYYTLRRTYPKERS